MLDMLNMTLKQKETFQRGVKLLASAGVTVKEFNGNGKRSCATVGCTSLEEIQATEPTISVCLLADGTATGGKALLRHGLLEESLVYKIVHGGNTVILEELAIGAEYVRKGYYGPLVKLFDQPAQQRCLVGHVDDPGRTFWQADHILVCPCTVPEKPTPNARGEVLLKDIKDGGNFQLDQTIMTKIFVHKQYCFCGRGNYAGSIENVVCFTDDTLVHRCSSDA